MSVLGPAVEDMASLLARGAKDRPDTRIRVGDRIFLAHSSILHKYIEPGSLYQQQDDVDAILHIEDVSADVFRAFLTYLYRPPDLHISRLDMTSHQQLYQLAHKTGVTSLTRAFLDRLPGLVLTQKNLLPACCLASTLEGLHREEARQLQDRVLQFLVTHLMSGQQLAQVVLACLSPQGEVSVPLQALLVKASKSVRFSTKVEEVMFLPNSALLANTAKNRKKAEKKRRCQDKRNSESDSGSVDTSRLSESQDDSGFASSPEESIVMEDLGSEVEEAGGKMVSEATGRETPSDFMFNMDF